MLRGMSFDIFTKFYANKLEMFQLSSFCMWKCRHNIINFFAECMVLTDDCDTVIARISVNLPYILQKISIDFRDIVS